MCESYSIYLDAILCRAIGMSICSCCILRGISGKKQCMYRELSILYSLGLPCLPYLSCLHAHSGKTGPRPVLKLHQPERVSTGELPLRSWKASGRLCCALRSRYVALAQYVRMTVINSSGKAIWHLQLCFMPPWLLQEIKNKVLINIIDFRA